MINIIMYYFLFGWGQFLPLPPFVSTTKLMTIELDNSQSNYVPLEKLYVNIDVILNK